jgi:Flp pilus assembly protein TadG
MLQMGRLVDWSRTLASDRRGNVAMMFALSVIPLAMLTGFVVDYARASALKAQIETAADAAVLAAVSSEAAEGTEQDLVEKVLRAHLSAAGNTQLKSVKVTSDRTELGRRITVAFTAESTNTMGAIFGMDKMVIANKASALASEPAYSDITFVLDKSSSMLLAASEADRIKMEQVTEGLGVEKCAFACHRPIYYNTKKKQYFGPSSTTVAKTNGVRLRMDVMKDAVNKILADLKVEQDSLTFNKEIPRYLATIVDFGADWQVTQAKSNNVNNAATKAEISKDFITSNSEMAKMSNAIKSIDGQEWEWTDFGKAWNASTGVPALPNLQSSGNGLSATTRKKYLVFVTDGVADYYDGGGTRWITTIDPAVCSPIKNRNIGLIVLYTRYFPLPSNSFYMANVNPWYADIETKLKNCATSNMFITADNEAEMNLAFKRIFTVLNGTRTRLAE